MMLTAKLSAKEGSLYTTIFKAFGMTRPRIENATSCSQDGRSTTTLPRQFVEKDEAAQHLFPKM